MAIGKVRPAIRTTGPWRLACLERRLSKAGVNVLLDTNVLSEPMRERPAFAGDMQHQRLCGV